MTALLLAVVLPAGYHANIHLLCDACERLAARTLIPVMAAQTHQESLWNPQARSPVGAEGVLQFMPGTREWWFPRVPGCAGRPASDVACSFGAAARYNLWHGRKLQGFATRREQLAAVMAAYNAGLGWVWKEQKLCAGEPGCDPAYWFGNIERQCARHPANCAQTRHYVRSILGPLLEIYHPLP